MNFMTSIKKMVKALFILSITLCLQLSSYAQKPYSSEKWKTAQSGGYTYHYVNGDPTASRFYTLKNGLTVILSVEKEKPRIQTYIAVKAGSKTDPATHTGLAHYLEHMLFKGTDKFGTLDYEKEKPLLDEIARLYEQYNHTTDEAKRKEIYKAIDSVSGIASKYAIANEYDKLMENMGAKGTNAFTSFEQTVYVEDIPSNAIDKFLAVQAERFRKPVLRIFHTELEAVYEEKNRSLDSDSRNAFEKFFELMFPTHNYGQQTTIGTIEHLKNPSLVEIQKYFDNYYVPNNMGIIMSGDFNPDEVIAKIDKAFAYMQPKPVQPYTFAPESPITSPIKAEVYGPNPEFMFLGYRFPGASTKDARTLSLVSEILTNGAAGLLDLNLVQQQKLLYAGAFPYQLIDYSMLILQGMPKEGQSLDEVQALILKEIDNLKKGNFSDDLIPAIVNNNRKALIQNYESYGSRASLLMDNFTSELDWANQVGLVDELKTITKKDIVEFANKYFGENYIAIHKRKGENPNKTQVEKPSITPVEVNRDAQSEFLKTVNALPENSIEPQWLDFKKDIQRGKAGKYEVLAIQNKKNDLFSLKYFFETGEWDNKVLPIAADYINYIGTSSKSAEQISKEFYALASTWNISVGDERTYINISGLNNNLEATIQLLDNLLQNAKADPTSWEAYKARLKKSRADAKENKGSIMQGLISYAKYGKDNPFNHVLTDEELDALTSEQVVNEIKKLIQYNHQIHYYGPDNVDAIGKKLAKIHKAPAKFASLPAKKTFTELPTTETKVLFGNYKMVQAELSWVRNSEQYDEQELTTNYLFNQYFGGGMGSLVFQNIRESKALAYSTYAHVGTPDNKDRKLPVIAYVGTQADKLTDAAAAMTELLTTLPQSDKAIESAKTGVLKTLSSERTTKDGIILSYLSNKRFGRDYDVRKKIYDESKKITFNELKAYHAKHIQNKPFIYCVVADENNVKAEDLEKLGPVQKIDMKTLFGY